MASHKQRQDLQRLFHHAKPQQPAVHGDGHEAEHRVGQGVLAQQGALVHVHQQAQQEGHTHTHAPGLVHIPEHHGHGQQVGHAALAAEWQHVHAQRQGQREGDEEGVDRQQQLVGPARHDHGVGLRIRVMGRMPGGGRGP